MTPCITICIDPLSRAVCLPAELCREAGCLPDGIAPDSLSSVVETPSCIIERPGGLLYYVRSIAWNLTVLIGARLEMGEWKATECRRNPEPSYIEALLKGGNLVLAGHLP